MKALTVSFLAIAAINCLYAQEFEIVFKSSVDYEDTYKCVHNKECVAIKIMDQTKSSYDPYTALTTSNDKIKTSASFNGEFIAYAQNMKLLARIPMKGGKAEGMARFYDYGKSADINYKNGIKEGLASFKVGEKTYEHFYIDGKIEGISKVYTKGELTTETPYIKGEAYGISKEYINGAVVEITPYKNGEIDGERISYYNAKKIREITRYDNGNTIDTKSYYESGTLKGEINYKENFIKRFEKEYFESGALKAFRLFNNNGAENYYKSFKENESVSAKESYKGDRIKVEYSKNGALFLEYSRDASKATQKIYHKNGQLAKLQQYRYVISFRPSSGYRFHGTQYQYKEDGGLLCSYEMRQNECVGGKWGDGKAFNKDEIQYVDYFQECPSNKTD